MLVPTPRKTKEMMKKAESTMATTLTQKLSLSRFIIMVGYPPRSSGAETIVYQVAAGYCRRDLPTGGLEHVPLRVCAPRHHLDHGEVSPLPGLQSPCLVINSEGAC